MNTIAASIKKVFIKSSIPILVVLIAMQLYFFVSYNYSEMMKISPERDENRAVKIQMLKALIEEKIHLYDGIDQSIEDLRKVILWAGELFNAKIWIENFDGNIVIESFTANSEPKIVETDFDKIEIYGNVSVSHVFKPDLHSIYTDVKIDTPTDSPMHLYVLYESEQRNYRSKFLLGLAGIILIVAVLVFSFYLIMRAKIIRFKASVAKIANGDISHRIPINGKGLLEEFGRAFNGMTGKLEKMITSSKEITANVSHEIRTPLTRIGAIKDLMIKKFDQGDFSDYNRHLGRIEEDIQVLDNLVGRLLEFIKLDTLELTPKCEHFYPSELVSALLSRFQPLIDSKKLNVKRNFLSADAILNDKNAILTVFLNVIDNAIKFTPRNGDITIQLRSEQTDFIAIITNSFSEMDQKDLDKIFNPFERAMGSEIPGSGLGLAIAKKAITNIDGSISACNEVAGFSIKIVLPIRETGITH